MDNRFLIYEGFEKDAKGIFNSLIHKCNLQITLLNDSGIVLENGKVKIEVSYETSIQVWVTNKLEATNVILSDLSKRKGLLEEYISIRKKEIPTAEKLKKISSFLISHFSKELSP